MKKILNAVLVVEGKSDVDFLSSFIEADFVTTNGSDVPTPTIDYLKELSKMREIIVLTDPDYPGESIRKKLDEYIPNLKHCFIHKEKAIKKGKVGVAESSKEEVLSALESCFTNSSVKKGNLTINDLVKLGLTGADNSKELRETLSEKFHLGHNNTKSFLDRVNTLGITYEELEKVIKDGR